MRFGDGVQSGSQQCTRRGFVGQVACRGCARSTTGQLSIGSFKQGTDTAPCSLKDQDAESLGHCAVADVAARSGVDVLHGDERAWLRCRVRLLAWSCRVLYDWLRIVRMAAPPCAALFRRVKGTQRSRQTRQTSHAAVFDEPALATCPTALVQCCCPWRLRKVHPI